MIPKKVFDFIMKWEGGDKYTNDPDDPGHGTKYGVTQASLDEYCDGLFLPRFDVKDLNYDTASEIYEEKYWKPSGCEALTDSIAMAVMDASVNCGVSQSVKWLQKASGSVEDGRFGPKTLESVKSGRNILSKIILMREEFYKELAVRKPNLNKFLKGWLNRIEDLKKEVSC